MCKRDDFPEPDGPTRATNSPSLILILKLSNNVIEPFECSKLFLRFLTSSKSLKAINFNCL